MSSWMISETHLMIMKHSSDYNRKFAHTFLFLFNFPSFVCFTVYVK